MSRRGLQSERLTLKLAIEGTTKGVCRWEVTANRFEIGKSISRDVQKVRRAQRYLQLAVVPRESAEEMHGGKRRSKRTFAMRNRRWCCSII